MAGYLKESLEKRLLLLLLLALALLLTPTGPAIAQDPTPDPPGRTGNLPDPEREPVVLNTRQLSAAATTTTLEFASSADTYIASNRPSQNFGSATGLFLGFNGGATGYGAERIFIRFDAISLIPRNARIDQARLRLYLSSAVPGGDGPMDTILRRTASAWGEFDPRWNNEPAWGEIRTSADIGSLPGWYEWNITGLVADWVRGTHPNYGMEIIGDERPQANRERIFYADETATDFYPRLIVTYTVGDTTPPNTRVNPLPMIMRSPSFTVSWTGSDEPGGSGIRCYDVRYRFNGGVWIPLTSCTSATSVQFTPTAGDGLYEFEARAQDWEGNLEAFTNQAEAKTALDLVPPFIGDYRTWLPFIRR